VDLLCDLEGVPRPVNPMTKRLVSLISRQYKAGFKAVPPTPVVKSLLLAKPATERAAMLSLFFLSGFRPNDMSYISANSWNPGELWTVDSKGMRTGRNIAICQVLVPPPRLPEGRGEAPLVGQDECICGGTGFLHEIHFGI